MIHVALVSSQTFFRHIMDHQLSLFSQKNNIEVVTYAYEGFESLRQARTPLPIVLVDLGDSEYLTLFAQIKNYLEGVVCVGVGYALDVNAQIEAFEAGMDDFIATPFSAPLLGARMLSLHALAKERAPKKQARPKSALPETLPFEMEEIQELEELLSELHRHVLIMGSVTLLSDDVAVFVQLLGKVASRFMTLVATFPLAYAIQELCEVILANKASFIEHAHALSLIAMAFVNDLKTWNREVLQLERAKPDFLNASIMANTKTFESFLSPQYEVTCEDDIFNF